MDCVRQAPANRARLRRALGNGQVDTPTALLHVLAKR